MFLKLLTEYAARLRTLVEQRIRLQQRSVLLVLAASSLFTLPFAVFLSNTDRGSLAGWLADDGALTVAVITVLFLSFLTMLYLYTIGRRRVASVEYEVALLTRQLDELVHQASQYEEHTERGPAHRLEFRLRLIEAQGALSYAERTVLRHKSGKAY